MLPEYSDLVLRRATRDDLVQVESIIRAAFAPYLGVVSPPPAPLHQSYDGLLSASRSWVVERDSHIVGCVVCEVVADRLQIDTVAVHPDHHGHGVGRQLIARAEQEARELGLKTVTLYTNAAMSDNLEWYPQLGYLETGRRQDQGWHRVFFTKVIESDR
ncbi:MAG: GNAT family N-acetyltransferase [Tetrasphaera sp.]